MSVAIVTGASGLVGSEAVRYFAEKGLSVVGADNDMRRYFFGDSGSTLWQRQKLERELPKTYRHVDTDVRDAEGIDSLFRQYGTSVSLVIHAAAQPSHDWAAREPKTDFGVNAIGTLHMLEATRRHAPDAVFIYVSTSKVYGDHPNKLPLVELATRWEIAADHPYAAGIGEDLSVDQCLHSVFGASKLAADIMVQEYARYFGLRTTCFRPGCLTGPNQSSAELHGFLAHIVKCVATCTPYTVFGYGGKQVRDHLHSEDLVRAFDRVYEAPRLGEVYNIGGGRTCHCSVLEAFCVAEEVVGRALKWTYTDRNRIGDHIWWISGVEKFTGHYPGWLCTYDLRRLCEDIYDRNRVRWLKTQ